MKTNALLPPDTFRDWSTHILEKVAGILGCTSSNLHCQLLPGNFPRILKVGFFFLIEGSASSRLKTEGKPLLEQIRQEVLFQDLRCMVRLKTPGKKVILEIVYAVPLTRLPQDLREACRLLSRLTTAETHLHGATEGKARYTVDAARALLSSITQEQIERARPKAHQEIPAYLGIA